MDQELCKQIAWLEAGARFPTGVAQTECGECKVGSLTPIACMFCRYGHTLECHYPYTCEGAECSHYQQEMEAEA